MKKNLTKPNDMFVSGTPMGNVSAKLSTQNNYANNFGYNEFACVQSKQKDSDSKPKGDTKLFFF